jgi:nucleoid-associated protein YgaU
MDKRRLSGLLAGIVLVAIVGALTYADIHGRKAATETAVAPAPSGEAAAPAEQAAAPAEQAAPLANETASETAPAATTPPVQPAASAPEAAASEPAPPADADKDIAMIAPDAAPPAPEAGPPAPAGTPGAPTFDVVRVEPSGETVVAGEAEPKATVEVLDGQTAIASAEADSSGAWALSLDKPLAPGSHDLALRTTSPDKKTQILSDQRVAVSVPEVGSKDVLVVVNTPNGASRVIEVPSSAPEQGQEVASNAADQDQQVASNAPAPQQPSAPPAVTAPAEAPAAAAPTAAAEAPAPQAPAAAPQTQVATAEPPAATAQPPTAEAPATAPVSGTTEPPATTAAEPPAAATAEAPAPAESEVASAEPPPAVPPADATGPAAEPGTAIATAEPPVQTEPQISVETAPAAEAPIKTEPPVASEPLVQAEPPVVAKAPEPPPPPEPKVVVSAVEADTSGALYIAGTATTPQTVRIYLDDKPLGEAKPSPSGTWLLQATRDLPVGTYSVRADQLDDTGSVVARSEVPFDREVEVAVLKPSAAAGTDTGATLSGKMPEMETVIIKRGDNLWRIARGAWGKGVRWSTIYQANADQIRNPHWIYPGQVFVMPKGNTAWTD